MFWCLILFAWMSSCFAVVCYDCYDTGPNHENCTKERSCTGLACMIFDAADGNNTMTAFCLLAIKDERISSNDSCWWEPEGHHCICYTDFCNHLIDSVRKYENKNPLLPKALYLKHNPLIDYGDSTKDSATDTKPIFGTHPLIEIETAHLRTSGNSQENVADLVPINFADYDKMLEEENSSCSAYLSSSVLTSITIVALLAHSLIFI